MTIREKQSVFTQNIGRLIDFAFKEGYELTFGEAYRTDYQQAEYVRTGFSKTMSSRHLYRLAVDFNLFRNGILLNNSRDFLPIGLYWESLHPDNVWGGDWNRNNNPDDDKFGDPYHFEMKP